jgi:hypothetical protein
MILTFSMRPYAMVAALHRLALCWHPHGGSLRPRFWSLRAVSSQLSGQVAFWGISCAISWTYAFLSSLSADQSLGYCGFQPAIRIRPCDWASLTAPGYGYKVSDAPPVHSLIERKAKWRATGRIEGRLRCRDSGARYLTGGVVAIHPSMSVSSKRQWSGIRPRDHSPKVMVAANPRSGTKRIGVWMMVMATTPAGYCPPGRTRGFTGLATNALCCGAG